jgi:hypothetical protein
MRANQFHVAFHGHVVLTGEDILVSAGRYHIAVVPSQCCDVPVYVVARTVFIRESPDDDPKPMLVPLFTADTEHRAKLVCDALTRLDFYEFSVSHPTCDNPYYDDKEAFELMLASSGAPTAAREKLLAGAKRNWFADARVQEDRS